MKTGSLRHARKIDRAMGPGMAETLFWYIARYHGLAAMVIALIVVASCSAVAYGQETREDPLSPALSPGGEREQDGRRDAAPTGEREQEGDGRRDAAPTGEREQPVDGRDARPTEDVQLPPYPAIWAQLIGPDGKLIGEPVLYPQGSRVTLRLTDADDPTPPPPPPTTGDPAWWPPVGSIAIAARDAPEVARAFDRLMDTGGFLTLETQDAVGEFVRRMDQGGGLRGDSGLEEVDGEMVRVRPERRVVIRTAPGVVIDRPVRNVKGQWSHLAFDGVAFTPPSHVNTIAIRLAGDCDDIDFLNCTLDRWQQVIEAQADGAGNEPDRVRFAGGSWTRIFNSASPVVTASNQNDKNHRSQGAWWRGEGWVFENLTLSGIGWDIEGDPSRKKTDKYSQAFYASQNARDTLIAGCVIDGVANNGIVYKGTGLTVRGCVFDRVVNAMSLGTNESPRFACAATIEDVEIRRLIPLNWKDDPGLPPSEQVRADSGVAISFNNVDGVSVRGVRVTGGSSGRRAVLLYFNNGKSTGVSAGGIVVEGCDAGPLDLAEVRDFRVPESGFTVRVRGTVSPQMRVLVRNTVPDSVSGVLAGFVIDGQLAGGR